MYSLDHGINYVKTRQNMKVEIVKPLDVETCSVAISLGATPEYNNENIVNENLYLKGDFSKIHPLLRKGQVIGRGATGHVYKLIEDSKTEVEYVVKEICLPAEDSEKLSNIFYREVEVLRGLPDHHRIIQFFGYCVSECYCSLYLAYMKLGSISAALRKGPFSEEKCFLYTGQILEGLEFLHKNGVIHRDIKGPNVLLEDENNIRITDFGLAKFIDDSDNTMELGTCRWMAPEVVNRKPDTEPYNFKADIWSEGCTALEMITAKVPYHDRSNIANIIFTLHNGESPKLPDNISERMLRLLKKTFVINHVERFSAEKLIEEFFSIESLTEKHCCIIQIQEVSFSEDKGNNFFNAQDFFSKQVIFS
uniref:Protein kinase domain-containing protein n=2 Tax=Biomphalaria glabrata TaxID=6526 RepID=A0A2C9M767_BIOGL